MSTGDSIVNMNSTSDLNCQVSKDIEDEANSYFQRIYNHPPHPTLSIDEILELLKKFQGSPDKRERVSASYLCLENADRNKLNTLTVFMYVSGNI